ncbi:hypothetical protein QQS21_011853 [Conoideocrella luteorostrata]|uniref:Heat-labile enterotoxin n=1 Tax=Conoideocrella luteorostrata TaxID=1105319 RepID=A0AAJ0CGV2_9HYPO|nr:hypothetical protein QQS21_011853 [Conoideocrella luteorostrata]
MFGRHLLSAALCLLLWFGDNRTIALPQPPPIPPRPSPAKLQPPVPEAPTTKPPAKEFSTSRNPEYVFRGSFSDPETVAARGGWTPRTTFENEAAFELYNIQLQRPAGAVIDTAYVSTSEFFEIARSYPTANNQYIYRIRGTPNMVDMSRTFGQYINVDEAEFAALGVIRWEQVHGWIKSSDIVDQYVVDEFSNHNFERLSKAGKYTLNKSYDRKFDNFKAGGAAPQLAGFPENHPARQQEPWKASQNHVKSPKDFAIEFMKDHGNAVGWDSNVKFPLANSPDMKMSPKQVSATGDSGVHATKVTASLGAGDELLSDSPDKDKKSGASGPETQHDKSSSGKESILCDPISKRNVNCISIKNGKTGESVTPDLDGEIPNALSLDGEKELALPKAKSIAVEELERISERFAEEEFGRMATKNGLGILTTRAENAMSFAKIKAKFEGYTPLTPVKVNAKPSKMGRLGGAGLAGLAGIGVGLWVKDTIDVFSINSTALERATVVTSIVPFLGCVVQSASNMDQGSINVVDNSVCVIADALLITPAWPVGLVLHAFRPILDKKFWEDAKKFWELLNHDDLYRRYFSEWIQYRNKILQTLESDAFIENVKLEAKSQKIGIIFMAARAAGALRAGTLQAATTEEERERIERFSEYAGSNELHSRMCNEFLTKKEELKIKLEEDINNHLEKQFAEFDSRWFHSYREFWNDQNGYAYIPSDIEPYLQEIRSLYGRGAQPGLKPGPEPSRYTAPLVRKIIDEIEGLTDCSNHGGNRTGTGSRYVSGLEVIYSDDIAPVENSAQEITNESADINYGVFGSFRSTPVIAMKLAPLLR